MKILTLFFVMLTVFSNVAQASCEDSTLRELYGSSDGVYLAIPTVKSTTARVQEGDRVVKTNFSVLTTFKGKATKKLVVHHYGRGSSWDQEFKKDEGLFLIFTNKDGTEDWVDGCDSIQLDSEGDSTELLRIIRSWN